MANQGHIQRGLFPGPAGATLDPSRPPSGLIAAIDMGNN